MLRAAHAWFWVAAWLYLLGRGTQAFPIGLVSAAVLGALLTPGIYGPLRLMGRERSPDLSGDFSAPVAVAFAGLFISFAVLGFMSLMGFWDVRPAACHRLQRGALSRPTSRLGGAVHRVVGVLAAPTAHRKLLNDMRADQLLVERGLAASRSQAVRLIAGGLRWSDGTIWTAVRKNGDNIPESAELSLADDAEARYVSRGGLKLEGALTISGVAVQGKRCLDIGQSTGGFTDCLLQQGAVHVTGVDVGHGQLHARIASDERVTSFEGVNARALTAEDMVVEGSDDDAAPEPVFDLIVGDLSFISLTLVLPALVPFLAANGDLLMLVKPQFELQPGQVGKGGIVRDPALYAFVEQRLRAACAALELNVERWFDSPISGGDGNREFFVHARHRAGH